MNELDAFTGFLRILLYFVLTTIFLLRAVWFPHFRLPSIALAIWWAFNGTVLFVILIGNTELANWLRNYLATLLLVYVVISSTAHLWNSSKQKIHD